MKKLFKMKWVVMAMIIAMALVIGACGEPEEEYDPEDAIWESFSDFAIRVSNPGKTPLVAFKGELDRKNVIGGVPAGKSNHGFKNDRKFFPTGPEQFRMIFLTKEQYEKNKNNLKSQQNNVFTQTFVFWNGASGDNSKVYDISDRLGGIHRLQIWNTSNFNVEFRENGTSGPTVGYAPMGMTQTFLYVAAGDYLIYPVFHRYNERRDMMETAIPITPSGFPFAYEFGFPAGTSAPQTQMLSLFDAVNGLASLKAGMVVVSVLNNSSTGIRFYRGSFPMTTPSGNDIISAGLLPQEFAIDMPKSGNVYSATMPVAFSIMQAGVPAQVRTVEGNLTNFTVNADMLYIINVTGSMANGDLAASIELRQGEDNGPVPFEPDDKPSVPVGT